MCSKDVLIYPDVLLWPWKVFPGGSEVKHRMWMQRTSGSNPTPGRVMRMSQKHCWLYAFFKQLKLAENVKLKLTSSAISHTFRRSFKVRIWFLCNIKKKEKPHLHHQLLLDNSSKPFPKATVKKRMFAVGMLRTLVSLLNRFNSPHRGAVCCACVQERCGVVVFLSVCVIFELTPTYTSSKNDCMQVYSAWWLLWCRD